MHVFSWIVTGIVVGIAAHWFWARRIGVIANLTLGALGGVLGGMCFRWLGVTEPKAGVEHVLASAAAAGAGLLALHALLRATSAATQRARGQRVPAPSLEAEIARLGEVERSVFAKLLRREPVARDPNAAFVEQLSFGDRVSDHLATFGGSWPFIGLFALVLIVWLAWNTEEPASFDPYPFILLNLVLSCLAAVQAPVILMSQNRMSAKDRADARQDYEVNLKAEMEILSLHDKLDVQRTELWKQALAMLEQQRIAIERLERVLTSREPS